MATKRLKPVKTPIAITRKYTGGMVESIEATRLAQELLINQFTVKYGSFLTSKEIAAMAKQVANMETFTSYAIDQLSVQFAEETRKYALAQTFRNISTTVQDLALAGLESKIKASLGQQTESLVIAIRDNVDMYEKYNIAMGSDAALAMIDSFANGVDQQALTEFFNNNAQTNKDYALESVRTRAARHTQATTVEAAQAVGSKSFVWSTSKDERVRDSHSEIDGITFNYDDLPEFGLPGNDYNCRCVAMPIIEF